MKLYQNILVLIALICLTETAAISCVKKYHDGDGFVFFLFAILLYTVVCFLLHKSFYFNTMGITNVLWSGVSVLFVIMAGVFLFHEKVHIHDIIGAALITIGMLIIRYTK